MQHATPTTQIPQTNQPIHLQSMGHLESFNSMVAERVFPGYKHSKKMVVPYHLAALNNRGAIGFEISSNHHFQLLLWFNILFFPFWAVGQIVVIRWKIFYFAPSLFHTLLMTIFYSFFLVIEPLRLWLGFAGNLKERVPDLAGCFLFTIFPQIFSCFYYMGWQPYLGSGFRVPFEVALNSAYCALLIPELYFCYASARAIIKSQAAAFFLTLGAIPSDAGILQAEQADVNWEAGLSRAA